MNLWSQAVVVGTIFVLGASGMETDSGPALAIAKHPANDPFVTISVVGAPGSSYVLQSGQGNGLWSPVVTNWSPTGRIEVQRSTASAFEFYRAVALLSLTDGPGQWLFDGRSLAGWNSRPQLFRVIEGAIVGGNLLQTQVQNEFLCTDESFTNFVLRLSCKLVGQGTGFVNSGIQFRSRRLAQSVAVAGYQADTGAGYWGSLYDESRRGRFLAEANQTEVAARLQPEGWNQYIIQAEGPRIRLWLNEQLTVDYVETDANIPESGVIGFQVHAGGPAEASFRDILIEKLP